MNIEQIFGSILQEYRLNSKMSQEELAFNSGLDRTYISLLERGKRRPTINTLFALSKALNVNPSLLITELEVKLSNHKI
ncbi:MULTISPECIES: helix-turn-helix domain-containing protein [Bacillus cereus group]|uniref:helix-turn-helix domain-containing protein n=1 Tax=Bacillus cereus group TaxID=86661 RepID=UPI000DCA8D02|nr:MULTISPECIES: helix-turn-helix transcriptional regulator [Bacillus cereus group]MED1286392.1 helix-turn-helix transcriptional regulator [Bacillus mycoides]RAS98594.1 transcriptional regulator [Bacillus cereus]